MRGDCQRGRQSRSSSFSLFPLPSRFPDVSLAQANVRHTEDIVELILDSNRNSLLGLDLKVSICTLGLTSGALIAGLFGMVRSLSHSLLALLANSSRRTCVPSFLVALPSQLTSIAALYAPRGAPLRVPLDHDLSLCFRRPRHRCWTPAPSTDAQDWTGRARSRDDEAGRSLERPAKVAE